MPCFSRQESTVAVDKMESDLAAAAIAAAGYAGQITYANGTLNSSSINITDEHKTNIKRAYSAEVVKATAKKFNWSLKQVAPFKYEITKTSY